MFQIDRSYIESVNLESLQSRIWDIRTDNKNDPTLPKIENYGITEEAFETYLEKKQKFEDFKETWHNRRLLVFGSVFLLTVALFSLFARQMKWQGYVAGLLLCMLIYSVYIIIEGYRGRQFRHNPNETFIKALLYWDEHKDEENS